MQPDKKDLELFKKWVSESSHIVFFGGAGVSYIHKAFPAFFFQQPPQTATSLHQNKSPKASKTT